MHNHRTLQVATCGLVLCCLLTGCGGKKEVTQTSGKLVVVSYGGGAYQESHIKAFLEPFTQATGVRTESVVWGAEYGRLMEMVRSGSVPWDVVEVTAAQYARGERDSIFTALDSVLPEGTFAPLAGGPMPTWYGVPNVYWSTVLAYRADAFESTPPKGWADFWDVRRFPGPRGLYDDPRGNLEFALIADGVPINKLYPLDVDRAFRKLDAIRSSVRVWWSDGTEPVNLLLTRQVVMTSAWSGRIFPSIVARKELKYTWDGAANELDYWIIPKGTKNVTLASRFIAFASEPTTMARQAEMTAYGPANALALQHVDVGVLPFLPTAAPNWTKSFVVNAEWWEANEQKVTKRWLLWKNQ